MRTLEKGWCTREFVSSRWKKGLICPLARDREEEEEEDLFVFSDTVEGLRAPAVKPAAGRVTGERKNFGRCVRKLAELPRPLPDIGFRV